MDIKKKLVYYAIGIVTGLIISLVTSVESFSTKYHMNLNCTDRNIKLLVPEREVESFERLLRGSIAVTNLDIIIKGQRYPMGP